MPRISQSKKDKISEQILHYLFTIAPEPAFTASISREIARDEEFIHSILEELKKKNLIIEITKNKGGKDYLRRRRWRLSNAVYQIYQKKQSQPKSFSPITQESLEL